ncbi:MAG: hypothetical protein K9L68_07635, partial [Spirochaetales bacterium]|nr:hypothetical protein [Spirochaetales bacterium]MCF7938453.1 hypothetical protein [Spirochaetales bacterium]
FALRCKRADHRRCSILPPNGNEAKEGVSDEKPVESGRSGTVKSLDLQEEQGKESLSPRSGAVIKE